MAGYTELYIDQGTSYSTFITITDDQTGAPVNVSGYSVKSQLRTSYYTANAKASFLCVITDAANGNISMSLADSQTSNISPGRYVFDVRLTSPANTYIRALEGIITLTPSVSR